MATTLVDALAGILAGGKKRKKPHASWLALAKGAPAPAARLLQTIAAHDPPSWEPGWRRITGPYETFARIFDVAEIDEEIDGYFDPTNSCVLGASGGGEVAWGFRWDAKKLVFVEAALEYAYREVKTFTPAKYLAHVRADELERVEDDEDGPSEELVALLAACGVPIEEPKAAAEPAPAKGARKLVASKLDETRRGEAVRDAEFTRWDRITVAGPTPSGKLFYLRGFTRYILAGDWKVQSAELYVHAGKAKKKQLPWTHDSSYGFVHVPNGETVVFTTDRPGALHEVDTTGKVTRRALDDVTDPHFVDGEHLAFVQGGKLCAYRYTPKGGFGSPVASHKLPKETRLELAGFGYAITSTSKESRGNYTFTFTLYRFADGAWQLVGPLAAPKGTAFLMELVERDGKIYVWAEPFDDDKPAFGWLALA